MQARSLTRGSGSEADRKEGGGEWAQGAKGGKARKGIDLDEFKQNSVGLETCYKTWK